MSASVATRAPPQRRLEATASSTLVMQEMPMMLLIRLSVVALGLAWMALGGLG